MDKYEVVYKYDNDRTTEAVIEADSLSHDEILMAFYQGSETVAVFPIKGLVSVMKNPIPAAMAATGIGGTTYTGDGLP